MLKPGPFSPNPAFYCSGFWGRRVKSPWRYRPREAILDSWAEGLLQPLLLLVMGDLAFFLVAGSELMACLKEDNGPPFFLGTSLSVRPQMAHWPLEGVFSPGLICLVARVAGKDPFS